MGIERNDLSHSAGFSIRKSIPISHPEGVKIAKKGDYFAKYEGKAREIIDALLDKFIVF